MANYCWQETKGPSRFHLIFSGDVFVMLLWQAGCEKMMYRL